MRIVVVGKGGREHALIRSLSESPVETEIFCFPGSDAISELATTVEAEGLQGLIDWMKSNSIDLCMAGEESYLLKDEGLANLCARNGIPCWGPPKEAALLEGSKEFAKQFMERHAIPTGKARVVESAEEAREVIGGSYPTVLKFDGLAAGKGVAVCPDEKSAEDFLDEVFGRKRFGDGSLLVEECLKGPEVSIFAAVSGRQAVVFTPARDYKLIGEGDTGANTGGMGAVASRQLLEPDLTARIEEEIIKPTIEGLANDDLGYVGFLYFGLMLTADGPKVIEYNCRFGDPECQAVMPLVSGDLATFCLEGARGSLREELLDFDEGWSVGVILASAGYPASSHSGDVIRGLDTVEGARVYHAGTRRNEEGDWETNGGRVLAVVAPGADRESAVEKAHSEAAKVDFDGSQRRNDIGRLHFD
ncbi:MAG: phosphoribosylamine--glycine ligase [Roseibacillus sp.]|nr:phosphoribosylamine--glycine ligase [Roseibacillus sp.]